MYPRAVLSPAVNTVTLRPETFITLVYDMVWSLQQHGIGNFLILM